MKTLVVLSLFVFVGSAASDCYNADWWDLLDKKTNTWATCDLGRTAKYITSLWRSANGGLDDDRVGRLEEARCCSPASSYLATPDADCVNANWWSSFDQNNKWSSCPDGHYLSGIFKTGADQWLHNIEEGKCCKPKGHPQSWGQCYDEDVTLSFDNRGWSGCNTDFYLVGLYRSVCNRLYCIETFKCCKMAEPEPPTGSPPSTPGSCGLRPPSRIVGGVAAKQHDWPWQAMLRTSSDVQYCGGTLVAPQWVVTAAHCVEGNSPSSVFVRLGAHIRTSDVGTEQDFGVAKVIPHPSYHKPKRYAHDIALLKLAKPAQLNRYVSLACLPDGVAVPADGKKCWITGWGHLSSSGAAPDILQEVSVPVISTARCENSYPEKIGDSMICAGLDEGGIDACQGDSGGPMVCEEGGRYYLQGVTSWGYGCASPGKFGVYAKVKFVMKWLKDEMAKN